MSEDFDQMEDGLQEPEQAEKKSKGLSPTVKYIAIGVGALIVNVIVLIVLIKFVFNTGGDESPDKKSKIAKVKGGHGDEEEDGGHHGEDEEKEFFAVEKERKLLELGRITTNPKNSSSYVAISISCIYRTKGEIPEEDAKPESEYMRKLIGKVKSTIINEIASNTVEDIQAKRLDLENILRDKLKPIFKDRQMFLREVVINEFILQ
jgi:hypothetical protein